MVEEELRGTQRLQLGKDPLDPARLSSSFLPRPHLLSAAPCPCRCPPAPSPGQPVPAVEPVATCGRAGSGLRFGGDGHLPLLCGQLPPWRAHAARPDTGPAAGPGPSPRRALLPAHPLLRRGLSRRPPPLAAAAPALGGCLQLWRLKTPGLGPCGSWRSSADLFIGDRRGGALGAACKKRNKGTAATGLCSASVP